jgi:heme O synthase-like polyprenyltransferase
LKTYNKIIYSSSLGACIIYFILRVVYEVSHIKIINLISSIFSLIVGIAFLIIALRLFFHNKNKKESIKPFAISIILIFANVIDYL